MTPELYWEQDTDGAWLLCHRRSGSFLFRVVSSNPRGFGVVTATSPTSDLEIRKGHTDCDGTCEEAIEMVKHLVDVFLERARREAGG
jgi:hypothetical protein